MTYKNNEIIIVCISKIICNNRQVIFSITTIEVVEDERIFYSAYQEILLY